MRKNKSIFSRKFLAVPYAVFMILFVVIPLLLIVAYAFTDESGKITLDNFRAFFSGGHNINTLMFSIFIGFLNTAICLLLGYPAAFILAKNVLASKKQRFFFLLCLCGLTLSSGLQQQEIYFLQ